MATFMASWWLTEVIAKLRSAIGPQNNDSRTSTSGVQLEELAPKPSSSVRLGRPRDRRATARNLVTL